MLSYFGYGLVFFLMGFACALAARSFRESRLAIGRNLPWLAAFGLLVGLWQWGVLFIPLQAAYLSAEWLHALQLLHAAVLLSGHACLMVFGLRLAAEWEPLAPLLAGTLAIGLLAMATAAVLWGTPQGWQAAARAVAAWGLGLPGAVMSARGLLRQRRDLARFYPWSARTLLVAAGAFIVSVPIGPLTVPLNRTEYLSVGGIPLQALVALGGLVLAVALLSGLEVLRVDQAARLERAERREAMLEERYRLSKDLGDGVIQDLFAVGMLVAAAGMDLAPAARTALSEAEQQLKATVARLRAYVTDLAPVDWANPCVDDGLRQIVDDFRAGTLIPVALEVRPGPPAAVDVARELYTVAHAALSNVRRHSRASLVTVALRRGPAEWVLEVTDNGQGIPAGKPWGPGLERMNRGAAGVGGALDVGPAPGGGTRIHLTVPIDPHSNTEGSLEA